MRKWASTSAKTMLMMAGFVALGSGVSFAGSGDASTSGDGSILDGVPGVDSTAVHQSGAVEEHASSEQIVIVQEHTTEQGEAAEEEPPELAEEATAPLPEAEEVADAIGAADPIGNLLGAAGVGLL